MYCGTIVEWRIQCVRELTERSNRLEAVQRPLSYEMAQSAS